MGLAQQWEPRAEWLEQGRLTPEEIARNLQDQAQVNRLLGGAESALVYLRPFIAAHNGSLSVLDIACGGGDMLRVITEEARGSNLHVHGVGVDVLPEVVEYARAHSHDYPELTWRCGDARYLPFSPRSFDVVICTAFLHHLSPEQAPRFLRQAAALARFQFIVTDVMRSRLAYTAYWVWSKLMQLSSVTHHDGLVSVRRAYTLDEFTQLVMAAGLHSWQLHSHSFYRMTLVHTPSGR